MIEEERKWRPPTRTQGKTRFSFLTCGCLGFIGLFVAVIMIFVFVQPIFRNLSIFKQRHESRVNEYETQWQDQNINSYEIEISYWRGVDSDNVEFVLVVENNEIISVQPQQSDFDDYQGFTIDGLFATAYDCSQLCGVTFDEEFGFPVDINHTGFIESGSRTQVLSFRPMTGEG